MSNKRNAVLTNAAFYAVLLFCLAGVGAGAYLMLFPGAEEPSGTDTSDVVTTSDSSEAPLTEVLKPVTVHDEVPPPEADPVDTPEEPVTQEPDPTEEVPVTVASIPDPIPEPEKPVVAEVPSPVVMPLEGDVVAVFSMDSLIYNETLEDWRTHDGIDISAEAGTEVLAAAAGTVADIHEDIMLGTTVVIQHSDGYRTTYASLAPEVAVSFGETVSSGQRLGTVGTSAGSEATSGPHLHFSVSKNGTAVDPEEYLK